LEIFEMSNNDPNTIFVGGINTKGDENSLKEFFETNFGEVVNIKLIYDHFTQRSKGYGFVTFKEEEVAKTVCKSNNLFFMGKMMNVGPAVRKNVDKQQFNNQGFQGGPPMQQFYNPYFTQPFYPPPYQYPQMGYPYPFPYPQYPLNPEYYMQQNQNQSQNQSQNQNQYQTNQQYQQNQYQNQNQYQTNQQYQNQQYQN